MQFGRETFFLRMVGDSMLPRFVDGEVLFVDSDEPAESGRFVAIEDPETGGRTARLLVEEDGRRVLRVLSGDWPECVLDRDNETMILGVVVFKGSAV